MVTKITEKEKEDQKRYRKWLIFQLRKEGVPEEAWESQKDEYGHTLFRLPKSEIELKAIEVDGKPAVLATLYVRETPDGYYASWKTYPLADLPNDLISTDDLKRFGIIPRGNSEATVSG